MLSCAFLIDVSQPSRQSSKAAKYVGLFSEPLRKPSGCSDDRGFCGIPLTRTHTHFCDGNSDSVIGTPSQTPETIWAALMCSARSPSWPASVAWRWSLMTCRYSSFSPQKSIAAELHFDFVTVQHVHYSIDPPPHPSHAAVTAT